MRAFRRGAVAAAAAAVLVLSACAPALPPSVVADSRVTVGWTGAVTSLNARIDPTSGNRDIAAVTRSSFGRIVDGEVVPDESFGKVTILGDDPFTVRYDLTEPSWSDRIPLDAADLVLGWAASVGLLSKDGPSDAAREAAPPTIDEFARSIDVTFAAPTIAWQTAVSVDVPAHTVGMRAFDLDDPMEAKQAVIRAVLDGDDSAISAIAEVWNTAFAVTDDTVETDLALSSGPYLVTAIGDEGTSVTLEPNPTYSGAAAPKIADIDLVPQGDDPIAAVGDSLDIATVRPTPGNRDAVCERERRDFAVQTTHDGTIWALLLSTDGVFADAGPRSAFLRMVPADDMVAAGAGEWSQAYAKTTSMVTAPGSRAFDIVTEDSGFADALAAPADDAEADRAAAGVATGTRVCVVYDAGSGFAQGAFSALKAAAAEAGWNVVDCATGDVDAAVEAPGWDAVIRRVRVPQTPRAIAQQWGTDGSSSLVGQSDPARDELISTLQQTVDVYQARDLLAQIEATIVRAAVAKPLAANPRVTVIAPDVTGVTVREGDDAPVLSDVAGWAPAG
ncbi:hypothetical protein ACIGEP_00305 [Microbacterium sp. NPDC077663]|uniref:hypothetical protein n=1 Tax=Microbacterium sp. NPDC077663 TaxID=3364189 RepID=UPI0037CB43F5